jgi:hypothetical protein
MGVMNGFEKVKDKVFGKYCAGGATFKCLF